MLRKLHILIILSAIAVMAAVSSCSPDWKEDMMPSYPPAGASGQTSGREINTDTRKVMLLYSAGYNSLSRYLKEDIEDLCNGWLPRDRRADDVILVYSHQPSSPGQYTEQTSPALFRVYSQTDSTVVLDTLVRYEPGTISASASQFHDVLSYVKDNFSAKSYGLVFSSHATGYLPSGFYAKPDKYTFAEEKTYRSGRRALHPVPVPYVEPEQIPGMPAVKSIGQDVAGTVSYEMDIKDFAEAIPMKLDYILFDACLMGGIEVAYEFAGKCDMVGFSQAEVLAEGFNYSSLATHLLGNKPTSDPYSVCDDYFTQYDIQSGVYRSATISLVDCNKLGKLADVCRRYFEKYRENIPVIDPSTVQRFYRSSHHWFYDLQSILEQAGITRSEQAELQEALDQCVLYKGATPSFMNEFPINVFCGFSMYLPSNGHPELDKYYKTLKWNVATGLVR